MIKINRAFISEVKKRLPKNVHPPLTLELLLKQKSIEKLEYSNINNENNFIISKKIIENFLKNNSSKPFSSLKKKLNMRQSILTCKKKLIDVSNINSRFNTPFQKQHLKMDYQRKLINDKINKKYPSIEINKSNKNVFGILQRNQSVNLYKIYNNLKFDGKYTYRPYIKDKTINLNNHNKEFIHSFYNELNMKSIHDYFNLNNNSSRIKKKIKPNCYYNKIHLKKVNKIKSFSK